ncbi:unnamed protein product [Aspergillus oryzae RIB40]|uniref:DNA, SC012 n=1 Tax=Aspergillus oryzae (strain ATCC 42149 / RIB 40) TaxID=510516 RepID=Q2UDF9_ASPOR|nr:unnamed protein product [Aspergillus oryzae RIB40]BAE60406.1 unnamed protein product [Aspergillus oryzae RIB40]
MYVNVKGLSDLCVRGGVTTEPSLIEDFVRGFNASYPLFDLVDIGAGKESAHDKIGDTLADRDLIGRVSLIEGLPFASDLDLIKASYRVTKFSDLFRDTKISVWAPWKAAVASKPRALLTPSPVQHVTLSRTSTNTTTTSNSVPTSSSSTTTPNSGEFQVVRSKSSVPPPPKIVERNKYGQRVDRLDFKTIPRDEVNRIKKLKLCNFYYLQGECPNDNCHHDHSRKLTKTEYQVLTAIARMTPCRYGLECDDPECFGVLF